MKRVKARETTDLKMDLTPLIDCVFLLILFFILTTEITVQVEDVQLPFAIEAKKDEPDSDDPSGTILINVVRMGETKDNPRAGKVRYNGEDVELQELTTMLEKEADIHARPKARGGKGFGWEIGPGGRLSKLSVIVRADRGVQSKHLRTVFTACADAKIYKVRVSAVQPEGARKR